MSYKNYKNFINEEVAVAKDKDIIKKITNNIIGIINSVKLSIKKNMINFIGKTIDGKSIVEKEFYYTTFKYNGNWDVTDHNGESYKDKYIIYKIQVHSSEPVQDKTKDYPKFIYKYNIVSNQILGKLNRHESKLYSKYVKDFEKDSEGITGQYLIFDFKKIFDLYSNNEDKEWLKGELNYKKDNKYIIREFIKGVEHRQNVKQIPSSNTTQPQISGTTQKHVVTKDEVKQAQAQISKKEQLKKDQEQANKNLKNPKNDDKYDAKKQVQMKKGFEQIQKEQENKKQEENKKMQSQIQQNAKQPIINKQTNKNKKIKGKNN